MNLSQYDSSPVVFSGETNPYKRQNAPSDSYSIFGKKIKKKKLSDIMSELSGMDEEDDGGDISVAARPKKAAAPMYDPNQYYGGLFNMYGGRKVRGGLLGE